MDGGRASSQHGFQLHGVRSLDGSSLRMHDWGCGVGLRKARLELAVEF